jgi:hypothetical protein
VDASAFSSLQMPDSCLSPGKSIAVVAPILGFSIFGSELSPQKQSLMIPSFVLDSECVFSSTLPNTFSSETANSLAAVLSVDLIDGVSDDTKCPPAFVVFVGHELMDAGTPEAFVHGFDFVKFEASGPFSMARDLTISHVDSPFRSAISFDSVDHYTATCSALCPLDTLLCSTDSDFSFLLRSQSDISSFSSLLSSIDFETISCSSFIAPISGIREIGTVDLSIIPAFEFLAIGSCSPTIEPSVFVDLEDRLVCLPDCSARFLIPGSLQSQVFALFLPLREFTEVHSVPAVVPNNGWNNMTDACLICFPQAEPHGIDSRPTRLAPAQLKDLDWCPGRLPMADVRGLDSCSLVIVGSEPMGVPSSPTSLHVLDLSAANSCHTWLMAFHPAWEQFGIDACLRASDMGHVEACGAVIAAADLLDVGCCSLCMHQIEFREGDWCPIVVSATDLAYGKDCPAGIGPADLEAESLGQSFFNRAICSEENE